MDIYVRGRSSGDVYKPAMYITGTTDKDAKEYATAEIQNGVNLYDQPEEVCDAAPGNLDVKIVCLGWPYHYLSYDPKYPDVPLLPRVEVSVGSKTLNTTTYDLRSSVSTKQGWQWGKRKLRTITWTSAFNYNHGWTNELSTGVTLSWKCEWEAGIPAETYSAYGFTCSTATQPFLQYYAVQPTNLDTITVGGQGLDTPLSFDSLIPLAQPSNSSTLYNFDNLHPECKAYVDSPGGCTVADYNWASVGLSPGKLESIIPSTNDRSQVEAALNAIIAWQKSSGVQLDKLVSLVNENRSGVTPLNLSFTAPQGATSNTQLSPITLHLYYPGETMLTVDVSAAEGQSNAVELASGFQYHVEPNPDPPKPPIPPAANEIPEDEGAIVGKAHRVKDYKSVQSFSGSWDKQSGEDVSLTLSWNSSRFPDYYFDYYYLYVNVPKLKSYLVSNAKQGETVQRPPWVPSYCWATGDSFMILFPSVAGIEPVVSLVPHR